MSNAGTTGIFSCRPAFNQYSGPSKHMRDTLIVPMNQNMRHTLACLKKWGVEVRERYGGERGVAVRGADALSCLQQQREHLRRHHL